MALASCRRWSRPGKALPGDLTWRPLRFPSRSSCRRATFYGTVGLSFLQLLSSPKEADDGRWSRDDARPDFFRSYFFLRFLERGWLASPGGRRHCYSGVVVSRPSVRPSVCRCLAAYFSVGAAGQVISAHLPHLRRRSDFRSSSTPRCHPDELLTSRRTRGNEWANASIWPAMTTQFILTFISFPRRLQMQRQRWWWWWWWWRKTVCWRHFKMYYLVW